MPDTTKITNSDLIGSKFTHNIASAVSPYRVKQLNIICEIGADLTIKSTFMVVYKKKNDLQWTTFETISVNVALDKYNNLS